MNLSPQQIQDFQDVVWQYYRESGRHDLPWRQPEADDSFDPYKILVSELMLQQTQVSRVIPKFQQFLELFPTIESLAAAPLSVVLVTWSGLGYNRRAKFLHQAAKAIVDDRAGVFPTDVIDLEQLPGLGKNTAGAILAYAFDRPVVFVETNIRTVYFYHFFGGREGVTDREVIEVVGSTLDSRHPREWYWALMDYGAFLKTSGMKLNALSNKYVKQSKFEGSKRQVRGQVLRALVLEDATFDQLQSIIPDTRLPQVLSDLLAEGLIAQKAERYHLSD